MTPRERACWLRAAGFAILIYSTLYFVRAPIEHLRERGLLRLAVGLVFLVAAVWLARVIWRRRPGRREIVVLVIFAALFLWIIALTGRPEERLHLLEYGLLGGLLYAALLERSRGPRGGADPMRPVALWVPLAAVLLGGLCGWIDEGIQHLLPNRMYDLRDVGLNLIATVLAVGALYGAGIARRADRAAR